MTDLENTLLRAQEEIRQLRAANADMASKLEIVELFRTIIMPQQTRGQTIDVVWELQQQIEIEKRRQVESKKAEVPTDGD